MQTSWKQPVGIAIEFCEFLRILNFVAADILPLTPQPPFSPSGNAYDHPA